MDWPKGWKDLRECFVSIANMANGPNGLLYGVFRLWATRSEELLSPLCKAVSIGGRNGFTGFPNSTIPSDSGGAEAVLFYPYSYFAFDLKRPR